MDPNAAYQRWKRAVARGDIEEASEAWRDLNGWMRRGGFPPDWSSKEQAAFRDWSPRLSNPIKYWPDIKSGDVIERGGRVLHVESVTHDRSMTTAVLVDGNGKRTTIRKAFDDWEIVRGRNPMSTETRDILVGVGLFAALGAFVYFMAQRSASAASNPTVVLVSPGATQTIANFFGATVELPAGAVWVSATGFDMTNYIGRNAPLSIGAGTSTTLTWTDASGQQQQMNLNVNAS